MRFLADESCDFRVVRALLTAGHDVTSVRDIAPELPDDEVIALARRDGRILITEDRDFGRIFFASEDASPGVILIRFPTRARTGLPAMVVDLVAMKGQHLDRSFTVIEPAGARTSTRR